jgi:hypothetical protein
MIWILALSVLQATTPPFVTIARGSNSGIANANEAVVRSTSEWGALWKLHGGREPVPPVDFAKEIVAAVFVGTRPTGGYSVEIVSTRPDGETLIVEYVERRPSADAIVTQALTSPFHIVKLQKTDGSVRFRNVSAPIPGR